jgi:hypothetical protein
MTTYKKYRRSSKDGNLNQMRDLAAIYLVEPGHWQWQQRQIFLNVALGGDWILCNSYKLTERGGQWATRGRGRTAAEANSKLDYRD